MGEQCAQAPSLNGQPAKLRSTSADTICGPCRERELDAQVASPLAQAANCDPAALRPVPEESRELFRASQVLLDEGITDEDEIIPTLVFAAMSWEMPILERVRDKFVEAGESVQTWKKLRSDFREAFNSLFVSRVVDGVLVLWLKDAYVLAHEHPETGLVEKIEIEVYRRMAKPEVVGRLYGKCLRQHGIPYGDGPGALSWWPFDGQVFRMLVRPRDLEAHPFGRQLIRARPETRQLPFPDPYHIQSMYETLLQGPADRALVDRKSGVDPKARYAIMACVAWYLGNRGESIKQRETKLEIAKLLNEQLLRPRDMDALPEHGWSSKDHVWRAAKNSVMEEYIARLENELRRRGPLLSTFF